MSKTSKIIRFIIAVIMALIASAALVYLVWSVVEILSGEMLAALILYLIFIYGIPFAVATIVYQIVLIVKKKVWKVDLIASIYLVAVWVSSILILLITALLAN